MDDSDRDGAQAALIYLLLMLRHMGGVAEFTDEEVVEFKMESETCVVSRDEQRRVVRLELHNAKEDLDAAAQRINQETLRLLHE